MEQPITIENNEIILRNSHGDIAIIPKKYKQEVQDMVADGCHGCIDDFVSKLPRYDDLKEDSE